MAQAGSSQMIGRFNRRGRAQRNKLSRIARIEEMWGYFFILPWVLGFLIFTLGPMLISLYWSFTRYEFPLPARWIGMKNYVQAFTQDDLFPTSLWNTTYYVLMAVPLSLVLSLFLALLLDRKLAGRAIWRTIYYIPSIVPAVVTAFLFGYLFQPEYGLINGILANFGIKGPGWFNSVAWVKPTFVLLTLWSAGGATMIIFLAGL